MPKPTHCRPYLTSTQTYRNWSQPHLLSPNLETYKRVLIWCTCSYIRYMGWGQRLFQDVYPCERWDKSRWAMAWKLLSIGWGGPHESQIYGLDRSSLLIVTIIPPTILFVISASPVSPSLRRALWSEIRTLKKCSTYDNVQLSTPQDVATLSTTWNFFLFL